MVYITSKKIGGKNRYFLVKSVRIEKKVEKITISLGDRKPNKKEVGILNEISAPLFYLKEAELKAEHAAKQYKSKYLTKKHTIYIETLRHFYKIYLHKLSPSELDNYKENFLIKYVYNTTSIEGNTTTLPETALILTKKIAPKGKELREIYEIENYEKLMQFMDKYNGDITKRLTLRIHKILMKNIDEKEAGKFRKIKVFIPGSKMKPADPKNIEKKIDDLIAYYTRSNKRCPLEVAAIFHHEFERIHPFTDGNGRVGRELLNFILKKNNFPPIIIEVKKRQEYIKSLMKADGGNMMYLILFIMETLVNQYKNLMKIDKKEIEKKIEIIKTRKI